MSSLWSRLLVALVGIPLLLVPLFYGDILLFLLVELLVVVSMIEYCNIIENKDFSLDGLLAVLIGMILPIIIFLVSVGQDSFKSIIGILFFAIFFLSSYRIMQNQAGKNFSETVFAFFGVFYISMGFSTLMLVSVVPGEVMILDTYVISQGTYWILLLFTSIWICDTSAYFVGKYFGRAKILPNVSPKKTYEGTIAGIVVPVLFQAALVCFGAVQLRLGICMFLAGGVAIFGVFGDFFESLMKREFSVKDSGNFLLGHGGFLDRFDSLLFAAPALYFVLLNFI